MSALEEYYRTRDPFGEDRAAADAAIESLKCCGNCARRGLLGLEVDSASICRHMLTNPQDRCHFAPSRWTHNDAGSDT